MVTVKEELQKEFRYKVSHSAGEYEIIIYAESQAQAEKAIKHHAQIMRGCYSGVKIEFLNVAQ